MGCWQEEECYRQKIKPTVYQRDTFCATDEVNPWFTYLELEQVKEVSCFLSWLESFAFLLLEAPWNLKKTEALVFSKVYFLVPQSIYSENKQQE